MPEMNSLSRRTSFWHQNSTRLLFFRFRQLTNPYWTKRTKK